MGGIGIWCMHFIGNRAIRLHDVDGPIICSSAFTAISFFLPILVLLGAFYQMAMSDHASYLLITFSGILIGAAVCGMHYVGQLGIVNYSYSYDVRYVVGVTFVAILASIVALSIFSDSRKAGPTAGGNVVYVQVFLQVLCPGCIGQPQCAPAINLSACHPYRRLRCH